MDVWGFLYSSNRHKRKKRKTKTGNGSGDVVIAKAEKEILQKNNHPVINQEEKKAIEINKLDKKSKSSGVETKVKPVRKPTVIKPEHKQFAREIKDLLSLELKDAYQGLLLSDFQGNLIFSDIFNPEKVLSLTDVSMQIDQILSEYEITSTVNEYLMFDLQDDKTLFIVKLKNIQLLFMFDDSFTNTGYIINIILPEIKKIEQELLIK